MSGACVGGVLWLPRQEMLLVRGPFDFELLNSCCNGVWTQCVFLGVTFVTVTCHQFSLDLLLGLFVVGWFFFLSLVGGGGVLKKKLGVLKGLRVLCCCFIWVCFGVVVCFVL